MKWFSKIPYTYIHNETLITPTRIIFIGNTRLSFKRRSSKNDAAGYHILIRKDGQRVFEVNGNYKFFKSINAFINAAIKISKTG